MSAALTSRCFITLTSNQGGTDQIKIFENAESYTNDYVNGHDAQKNMNEGNPTNLNIYSVQGTTNVGEVRTDAIVNLPIIIETNDEGTHFTMTFQYILGTITLYDAEDPTHPVTLVSDDTYEFDLAAGRKTLYNRFYLNYNPAAFDGSITTNAYGFCSFASASAITLPAGLKAYKGAFEESDYSLTLSYIGQVVPANEGVILWTPTQTAQTFYYNVGGSTSVDMSDNDFVGAVADVPVAGISADAIYCLHGNELQKYVGTDDIPAGKAYLPVTASGPNPAPKHIRMVINQEQGVENVVVESVKAEKFVENGQIFIRRGNEVYNLQGQIVK